MEFQIVFLVSVKILMKPQETLNKRSLIVLSKFNLDVAHLSAYSADSECKCHPLPFSLSNENFLPANCPPHLVHRLLKRDVIYFLSCDIDAFIMKVFGDTSVSHRQFMRLLSL